MDKEIALQFRDQLRAARTAASQNAEDFQEIVLVIERMGAHLYPSASNLKEVLRKLEAIAAGSPMAEDVPKELPDFHQRFPAKCQIVREGRNAMVHEGALARHLTLNAVEISLVLEEALMSDSHLVGDFMVRNPVCGYLWQPLSFLRQTMLVNSFSYLPVPWEGDEDDKWRLLSDFEIAKYLRSNGKIARKGLVTPLKNVVAANEIKLVPAKCFSPRDTIKTVLQQSDGNPCLVVSQNAAHLLGIITPFDLL